MLSVNELLSDINELLDDISLSDWLDVVVWGVFVDVTRSVSVVRMVVVSCFKPVEIVELEVAISNLLIVVESRCAVVVGMGAIELGSVEPVDVAIVLSTVVVESRIVVITLGLDVVKSITVEPVDAVVLVSPVVVELRSVFVVGLDIVE